MTTLYFKSYGSSSNPSIVFLHGGGATGWMWDRQVAAFQEHYHLLVPDLPEQGKSAGVAFTHQKAAAEVADLIRSQAGGKAHVVGLSEGAQVVVELLANAPEVVESAFISSALLHPVPGNAFYTEGILRWSYRLFLSPFKNWDWWIRLNMRYSAGIPEDYFPQFRQSFREQTEDGFVHMLMALHYRKPSGLAKVQAPCLIAVGEHEYEAMKQSGRDLLAELTDACGVMVALGEKSSLAAEHNWAMTAPGLFNRTLEAWINRQTLPNELKKLV